MSIHTTTFDGIAEIEIARPEKKNAITVAMYQQLADALRTAAADASAKVVLIRGQRAIFTAGNDLEDFLKNPPMNLEAPVFQFMAALRSMDKPVVAAVNGPAVGIGMTMLMHCDLVYGADDAMFSMPFVSLGVCPEFGASLLVPLAAGYHRAAEKLLLGEPISAEEAVDMGIVNRLLAPDDVLGYARKQALRLAQLPPTSVRVTKRLMRKAWDKAVDETMRDEAENFGRLLGGAEAKEAFTAFFERRKPDFSRFA